MTIAERIKKALLGSLTWASLLPSSIPPDEGDLPLTPPIPSNPPATPQPVSGKRTRTPLENTKTPRWTGLTHSVRPPSQSRTSGERSAPPLPCPPACRGVQSRGRSPRAPCSAWPVRSPRARATYKHAKDRLNVREPFETYYLLPTNYSLTSNPTTFLDPP